MECKKRGITVVVGALGSVTKKLGQWTNWGLG